MEMPPGGVRQAQALAVIDHIGEADSRALHKASNDANMQPLNAW